MLYFAKRIQKNQLTGEVIFFSEEDELNDFLRTQNKLVNKEHRGFAVELFINKMNWNPIHWNPEKMGKDESIDYIEEYRQFKSNLKTEHQKISVCLFLKNYPKVLIAEEIQKLLKL